MKRNERPAVEIILTIKPKINQDLFLFLTDKFLENFPDVSNGEIDQQYIAKKDSAQLYFKFRNTSLKKEHEKQIETCVKKVIKNLPSSKYEVTWIMNKISDKTFKRKETCAQIVFILKPSIPDYKAVKFADELWMQSYVFSKYNKKDYLGRILNSFSFRYERKLTKIFMTIHNTMPHMISKEKILEVLTEIPAKYNITWLIRKVNVVREYYEDDLTGEPITEV